MIDGFPDSRRGAEPVSIEADELLAARRDPAVHSLLEAADAEGEQVLAEGRDHTGIDHGAIQEIVNGRPVVPLESTILFGGMPYIKNPKLDKRG
jgi:hypothetical protein